jgi:uncharacterized protein (TIGR00251 family)
MFYEKTPSGYILRVRVTPNASKNMIGGVFLNSDDIGFIKISVTTVPEKGKANQDLIKYLSKLLDIAKTNFTIITGESDRYKKISINISPSKDFEQKLQNLEQKP